MIEGHTFVDAYFTNDDRNVVETLWWSPEEEIYRPYIIMAEEGNLDWQKFLETPIDENGRTVTLDDLHESTVNKFRRDREDFERSIYELGQQEGMIYDTPEDPINSDLFENVLDIIFEPYVEEDHKEKLFMLKLKLFENETIKLSKDRPLKAKLRKAKNFVDVIKYATMIYSPEAPEEE